MKNQNEKLIDINNLVVHYETEEGVVEAVNDVSLNIKKGEVLGLVGETGAGKTTIALSIMRLLPDPPAHVIQGNIKFEGIDLMETSNREMTGIRGNQISMIFQDPMTALNPVHRIGEQVKEVIRLHSKLIPDQSEKKAIELLDKVGISPERYNDYPHQFSGGMKQRVIIAMALVCEPKLLIADEPTSALDVTIQAQILEMIKNLQDDFNTAMMLITHDLGLIADVCDRCAVIYAGQIVEIGTLEDIYRDPIHPYTIGLFNAIPSLDKDVKRLKTIEGKMIDPTNLPSFCSFYDRCSRRTKECTKTDPDYFEINDGHFVKCLHYDKKTEEVI